MSKLYENIDYVVWSGGWVGLVVCLIAAAKGIKHSI
jgi:hypothetical protein